MPHYKSIFVSDCHLGSRGSQAEKLIQVLENNTYDNLFLIGDIIDGWRLKKSWYWPQSHNDVLGCIFSKASNGTQVIYITGNHDDFLREFTPFEMGNIQFVDEYVYETDNKKYLIIHGDKFDNVIKHHKWVAILGDIAYNFLLWVNRYYNHIRRFLGKEYWSLSKYIKYKVKKAVEFVSCYENEIAAECDSKGYTGVFCGHIHHPEKKMIHGIQYYNTGDFVENTSYIIETVAGDFYLVNNNIRL